MAALLTFAHYRGDGAKSDLSVSRMLEAYLNRPESEVDPTRQAQLVPRLTVGSYAASYPSLSFRVGFDKLYVVKNIKTFLELVSRGEEASYGKGLLLCHAASQFDGPSRALIALLMNEFRSFRTFEPGDAMYDDYENPMKSRSELQLTGAAFDRFFQIYLHRQVACSLENCDSVLLEEGDPPVTLRLRGGRTVRIWRWSCRRGAGFSATAGRFTPSAARSCCGAPGIFRSGSTPCSPSAPGR